MPIIASYDPIAFDLTVAGDLGNNAISVSRNGAGSLLVNGGTVPVSAGAPTVANTDLIEVSGDLGDDTIALDETNGALPSAELVGGGGGDTLTGASNVDTLLGEAGNDTLLGRGGVDVLDGGGDNDVLVGGDGDDQMFGGTGTDRLIWNPGDDNDLWEGGDGSDTGEVNGGGGAEVFTVTANGARVRFDRLDPAPFSLDIGTTESLVLNAGGGDDTISTTGNLAALISLILDGGAGNDAILAGNGGDILLGGEGNDFVDGQQGNDVAFLGVGNDVFQWDPGDGSDTIEGQADVDSLLFNGSAANEIYDLSANGARALLQRNVGAIVMDINDVERVTVNALGGIDSININDLGGTDVVQVTLNLSGTIGGVTGDAAIDTVAFKPGSGNDTVAVSGSVGAFTVNVPFGPVAINQAEATDVLIINGGLGNDILSFAVPYGGITVWFDGGEGSDALRSGGDGTYLGGTGDDIVYAGLTNSNETLDGGDGIDTLDTTSWGGSYTINMATGITNYSGESFTSFENLITGAGIDVITGTVAANIVRTNAGADNVASGDGDDTIEGGAGGDMLAGGAGIDTLSYAGSSLPVYVRLFSSSAFGGDATGDALSGFENAVGSKGNDDLIGSSGINSLEGGLGNDIVQGLAGSDVLDGGGGIDTVSYAGSSLAVYVRLFSSSAFGGDAGGDIVVGFENVLGSSKSDDLMGSSGANLLDGGLGNDTLQGLGGDDVLRGGTGGDTLDGGTGIDTLSYVGSSLAVYVRLFSNSAFGGEANGDDLAGFENVLGSSQNDDLIGTSGANVLNGSVGNDTLQGLGGGDVLVGGAGNDALDGGAGGDTLSYAGSSLAVYVRLFNGTVFGGDANGDTIAGFENVLGSSQADDLVGSASANLLDGALGNDTLSGLGGADVFRFSTALGGANVDTISGYSVAEDVIQLDNTVFTGLTAGTLTAGAFNTGLAASQADDRIVYNAATGMLLFDADGSGAGAAIQFATLGIGLAMTASEFVVI